MDARPTLDQIPEGYVLVTVAARILGRGRYEVHRLIKSGVLEANPCSYAIPGKGGAIRILVSLASVARRLQNPRLRGRPRKSDAA